MHALLPTIIYQLYCLLHTRVVPERGKAYQRRVTEQYSMAVDSLRVSEGFQGSLHARESICQCVRYDDM